MEVDLFSKDLNNVGYIGNTLYSSAYMTRCRNFRTFVYENSCGDLERILEVFLKRHKRTNYKLLLRKSQWNAPCKMQATSRRVVREYVHRLIFNVIPLSLFGSKDNQHIFERNLRNILFLGKFQRFSLDMVVRNIRLRKLSYLQSIDHYINKSNLMAKLYIWLVKVYIFGALKCVFYVTESNTSFKYSFYEKRIWQTIQERGLKKIKKEVINIYKNCVLSSAYQIKNLFILKILPKRRGSRPIFVKWKVEQNWRQKLRFASAAAKVLLHNVAEPYFKNVYSSHEVFHKNWIKFFSTWQKSSQPFVYFVRIDFVDAFGSILHDKLIQLISRLKTERVDFTRFCFKYRGYFRKVEVKYIFEILEDAVLNFAFKDNNNIYKLTRGICQGSSLSSVLCNLYIGEMSSLRMREYADDEHGFFSRNCDDYLYLTFEKEKAISFLNLVKKGFPDFNLKINDGKTETNLFNSSQTLVSFGNYRIDVERFQLYGCYQSFQGVSIFHKSKVLTIDAPGKLLLKRLLATCCQKLDNVFFDSSYNSEQTMLYNVFLAALLSAARCFAYVYRLFIRYNHTFIFKCVRRCAKKMTLAVMQNKSIAAAKSVTEETVEWIILKGFLVRLRAMRFIWLAPIEKRIRNSMKILKLTFDENEREVIQRFRDLHQPNTFRSIA